MGSIEDYLSAIGKSKATVHDPWSHANSLLRSEEDIPFEKKYYGKIVGFRVILSNIGSDPLMFLNQNDVGILTAAYEIALREKEFRPVFEYMYHSWVGGLMLTRTKDGWERQLQATAGKGYSPEGEMDGYGSDLNYGEEPRGGPGILDRLQGIKLPRPKQGGQRL